MKIRLLCTVLALAGAGTAAAAEPGGLPPPAPAAAEPASPRLAELEERLDKAVADLEALEERLAAVEERLGEANRFRSPMDTIERRLEDLERTWRT